MHEDSSSCVMNIVQATVDGLGVGECGPWPLPLQGKAHSKVPFQGPRLIEFSKILAKLLHDPAEQIVYLGHALLIPWVAGQPMHQ